jgi:hypothetical protein
MANAIEYGLISALVATSGIVALESMGVKLNGSLKMADKCRPYAGVEKLVEGKTYSRDINCDGRSDRFIIKDGEVYVSKGTLNKLQRR